ncbi:hypothetical protein C368_04656 [Cryptococcus neoformans 125.91]|nr:hypothetical protein C368_04656 [Cryptococcus neoformans var. grubii 125.91]
MSPFVFCLSYAINRYSLLTISKGWFSNRWSY